MIKYTYLSLYIYNNNTTTTTTNNDNIYNVLY